MSRETDIWDDGQPTTDPVLSHHASPNYSDDPGTGVAFHIEEDEVWVLLFWDGANRMTVAFTREEFLAAFTGTSPGE